MTAFPCPLEGSLVTLSRSEGSVSLGLEMRIEADKSAVGTVNRPLRPLCSAFATRSRLVDCQQTIHTPQWKPLLDEKEMTGCHQENSTRTARLKFGCTVAPPGGAQFSQFNR